MHNNRPIGATPKNDSFLPPSQVPFMNRPHERIENDGDEVDANSPRDAQNVNGTKATVPTPKPKTTPEKLSNPRHKREDEKKKGEDEPKEERMKQYDPDPRQSRQ